MIGEIAMMKKIKRSIDKMPRCAYIFLKNVLRLSCIMLFVSLCLFLSDSGTIGDYERTKFAFLFLENPAGLLLVGIIGTAFFIDRS